MMKGNKKKKTPEVSNKVSNSSLARVLFAVFLQWWLTLFQKRQTKRRKGGRQGNVKTTVTVQQTRFPFLFREGVCFFLSNNEHGHLCNAIFRSGKTLFNNVQRRIKPFQHGFTVLHHFGILFVADITCYCRRKKNTPTRVSSNLCVKQFCWFQTRTASNTKHLHL